MQPLCVWWREAFSSSPVVPCRLAGGSIPTRSPVSLSPPPLSAAHQRPSFSAPTHAQTAAASYSMKSMIYQYHRQLISLNSRGLGVGSSKVKCGVHYLEYTLVLTFFNSFFLWTFPENR